MKLSFVLPVLALLSGSAAFAQQEPPSPAPASPDAATQPPPAAESGPAPSASQASDLGAIFDKLNTSHTGKLTRDEAQAHPTVAANFDAADANKDGVLTKDEFLAAFRSR